MFYTAGFLIQRKDRPNKPWMGCLKYKDSDGKWREARKTFKGIRYKKDAQKELRKWWDEMESKADLSNKGETIEKSVRDYLSLQLRLNRISNVTYQNNLRLAETVVFPAVGSLIFADATQEQIQDFVNQMTVKYKPSTVRTIFAVLSKTYKNGLRYNKTHVDPTRYVDLPRESQKRINYLDADGRRRFLALMGTDCPFYYPSMIALYTGMRCGEICGLQWKDINFGISTIYVRRSAKVYKDKNGKNKVEVSSTKNYKTRTVPLISPLREILEELLEESEVKPTDYVIECRHPRLLCTSFIKWATRHDVKGEAGKPITMHGLRHTYATMAVQSGMDIKSLSSILGHSSTAMTLDIYASDDEMAKQTGAELLQNMFKTESENDF